MSKFVSCAGIGAVALAISTPAMAAELYGTVGYTYLDQDLRDTQLGAIQGRFGAKFTPHVGIEGEAAIGVSGDEYSIPYLSNGMYFRSKTDLSYQVAVYGVAYLPVSPKAELLARVGYGRSELEHDWAQNDLAGERHGTTTAHANSWNYGVGGQYYFDGQNGVRLDYTRYDASGSNSDTDAWSIGYTRRF